MRLIDADNIISVCEILSEKCNDQHYWNQLISIIKDVPTVDAIPVEWLKKKLEQKKQQRYGQLGVASITKVLMYWEKEHDGNDD